MTSMLDILFRRPKKHRKYLGSDLPTTDHRNPLAKLPPLRTDDLRSVQETEADAGQSKNGLNC